MRVASNEPEPFSEPMKLDAVQLPSPIAELGKKIIREMGRLHLQNMVHRTLKKARHA